MKIKIKAINIDYSPRDGSRREKEVFIELDERDICELALEMLTKEHFGSFKSISIEEVDLT